MQNDNVHFKDFETNIFSEYIFSPGEIYWIKKNGKKLKILNPLELLSSGVIQKFKGRSEDLKIVWKSNRQRVSDGKNILTEFFQAESENERAKLRFKFIVWLRSSIWSEDGGSLNDLIHVFTSCFPKNDNIFNEILVMKDLNVTKRSLIFSSLVTAFSLLNGYLDKVFLKDIYISTFFYDHWMKSERLSEKMKEYLEELRITGGHLEDPLYKEIMSYVETNFQEIVSFSTYIDDKNVLRLFKRYYERPNGGGFPFQLKANEISDIEGIIIFVQRKLSYHYEKLNLENGFHFMKNIFDDDEEYKKLRAYHILKEIFEDSSYSRVS